MSDEFDALSLKLKAADEGSDSGGKQDINVLNTKTGSRDLRLHDKLSKVFVVELLLLKSDHSLFSSGGLRSSLPAMLFLKIFRVRLVLVSLPQESQENSCPVLESKGS